MLKEENIKTKDAWDVTRMPEEEWDKFASEYFGSVKTNINKTVSVKPVVKQPEFKDFTINHTILKNLFRKYNFKLEYFKGYQCEPEIKLLAMALFTYLETFECGEYQTWGNVLLLLKNTKVDDKNPGCIGNLDKLFEEAAVKSFNCYCVNCYRIFKEANYSKIRDAIISLYEYYICGQYIE